MVRAISSGKARIKLIRAVALASRTVYGAPRLTATRAALPPRFTASLAAVPSCSAPDFSTGVAAARHWAQGMARSRFSSWS